MTQADALYNEAVGLDLFPSLWQRSVINEPGLRAQAFWKMSDLKSYSSDLNRIEQKMDTISRFVYKWDCHKGYVYIMLFAMQ